MKSFSCFAFVIRAKGNFLRLDVCALIDKIFTYTHSGLAEEENFSSIRLRLSRNWLHAWKFCALEYLRAGSSTVGAEGKKDEGSSLWNCSPIAMWFWSLLIGVLGHCSVGEKRFCMPKQELQSPRRDIKYLKSFRLPRRRLARSGSEMLMRQPFPFYDHFIFSFFCCKCCVRDLQIHTLQPMGRKQCWRRRSPKLVGTDEQHRFL